jgi:hypothetical protein
MPIPFARVSIRPASAVALLIGVQLFIGALLLVVAPTDAFDDIIVLAAILVAASVAGYFTSSSPFFVGAVGALLPYAVGLIWFTVMLGRVPTGLSLVTAADLARVVVTVAACVCAHVLRRHVVKPIAADVN